MAGPEARAGSSGYRRVVLPLGFRFEVDAVIVGDTAHRHDCPLVPAGVPLADATVAAGATYRSERCPRECRRCQPPFETLLSYQLPPAAERAPVPSGR